MTFDEYLAVELHDPRFRFWLRSTLYRVCLWLVWELGALADHQVQAGEYPLPTLRELWRDWRGLRGELSARLDFESRVAFVQTPKRTDESLSIGANVGETLG